MADRAQGPHQGQPTRWAGRAIDEADGAVILVHGRGATADSILSLAARFDQPSLAYAAPQAADHTWYPQRFIAPLEANEPHLSSALQVLDGLLAHLDAHGIPPAKTVLGGFSQGACLASEFAARRARRYGGIFCFSGGLIGPDGTPRDYTGTLDGTPVFLGCSDTDHHIPLGRVHESTEVLQQLGGDVTERIYPGMGHTVNQDEIDHVARMLQGIVDDDG